MSKGQTKKTREAAGNRRKLTRAEKKQIAAVIRQAKGDGKAHTAQQTIPYLAMYPDGICKVAQRKYSKSIAFEDINYQLAQADDKTAIFENWCDFLNYFDASVNVQLSFINQGSQQEQAARAIHIPPQNDDFNSIRTEYSDMLKMQLAKGNNGLVKHKYITFSIEADNPAAARARLSRIETDVLNNFKVLGVSAHPLSGYERLKVLHGVFHPAGEPFSFSYDWLTPTGLTTKDFIAPSSFKFGEGRYQADYENFSNTEYLFGGTSIKREAGKDISVTCTLEVSSGTAKVFWISGADEAVTLLETTGTYSDTITLPDGGNYIGIECEDFTGKIEMNIE